MFSAGSNSSCNVIVAQSFLTTPAKFWIDSTGAGMRESVDIKPEPMVYFRTRTTNMDTGYSHSQAG